MKTYEIKPQFSFLVASPIMKKVRVSEGETLYDRDGEMRGIGRDAYEMRQVGQGPSHKLTVEVAYWGGDRYQPPHVRILSVEVEVADAEAEVFASNVTSTLIRAMAAKVLDLPGLEVSEEKVGKMPNLFNYFLTLPE